MNERNMNLMNFRKAIADSREFAFTGHPGLQELPKRICKAMGWKLKQVQGPSDEEYEAAVMAHAAIYYRKKEDGVHRNEDAKEDTLTPKETIFAWLELEELLGQLQMAHLPLTRLSLFNKIVKFIVVVCQGEPFLVLGEVLKHESLLNSMEQLFGKPPYQAEEYEIHVHGGGFIAIEKKQKIISFGGASGDFGRHSAKEVFNLLERAKTKEGFQDYQIKEDDSLEKKWWDKRD